MNTDERECALIGAERRVLEIQTKLHRWAREAPHRRFDDLFNLVVDPAFLLVAWARVRGNKGARTAGVDGNTAYSIEAVQGIEDFLERLRISLKDRSFCPLPVRERMIPKPNGKLRRLGIATMTDRVVQASLKLVLEPIFEADFCRVRMGSARTIGSTTRWPRCAISPPAPTSGLSRATSRRVSMKSRIRRSWTGCAGGLGTSAYWPW